MTEQATSIEPMGAKALRQWSVAEIGDGGERLTHLYPNDCYYAHLSLYAFALPFARGGNVLDAGSGAGYGAAYLAENGARAVWGVDASTKAVAFSRDMFPRYNLQFHAMSLENLSGFPDAHFDLVFSSNVFEHVIDVHACLATICRMLKPDGTFIIVVPPVVSPALRQANIDIPFHLNIWSPQQWHHALAHYFTSVQTHAHYGTCQDVVLDFQNSPDQTVVSEKDFALPAVAVEELYDGRSLSAVFVARKPRPQSEVAFSSLSPRFIDDSFTRHPSVAFLNENGAWQDEHDRFVMEQTRRDQQIETLAQQQTRLWAYTQRIEHELARKNQHIRELELQLERVANGRLLRLVEGIKRSATSRKR